MKTYTAEEIKEYTEDNCRCEELSELTEDEETEDEDSLPCPVCSQEFILKSDLIEWIDSVFKKHIDCTCMDEEICEINHDGRHDLEGIRNDLILTNK